VNDNLQQAIVEILKNTVTQVTEQLPDILDQLLTKALISDGVYIVLTVLYAAFFIGYIYMHIKDKWDTSVELQTILTLVMIVMSVGFVITIIDIMQIYLTPKAWLLQRFIN